MGWTVLYVAFGIVALWLLGEVLLQYKARLRWRLVAFFGFLLVVLGVVLPSVPVIAVGAAGFAVGQTFVTLSFRRGFSTGWALGGKPGTSRRRRDGKRQDPPAPSPPKEMRPLEPLADDPLSDAAGYDGYGPAGTPADTPADGYADTPAEGYADTPAGPASGDPAASPADTPADGVDLTAAQGPAGAPPQDPPPYPPGEPYGAGPGYGGQEPDHQPEQPYAEPYAAAYAGSDGGGGIYAAYSDPYIGGAGTPAEPAAGTYPDYATETFPAQSGYAGDPLGEQAPYGAPEPGWGPGPGEPGEYAQAAPQPYPETYTETPPGGVWMPQQRDAAPAEDAASYGYPPQQPDPYAGDEGYGSPGHSPGHGHPYGGGPAY